MTKEQLLIDRIKQLDNNALRDVYEQHRQYFISYFSKYKITSDDILDIYQDSIVAFYENAKKGKLDNMKSAISTYIIAIGKYKVYAHLKKVNIDVSIDLNSDLDICEEMDNEIRDSDRIKHIQYAFKSLGEKCREILTLFYYENKKLDEIQDKMQYENKDVLKSQKSRCLKRLRELVQQK